MIVTLLVRRSRNIDTIFPATAEVESVASAEPNRDAERVSIEKWTNGSVAGEPAGRIDRVGTKN